MTESLNQQIQRIQQQSLLKENNELPFWDSNEYRAMPNDIARCALFTIRNKRLPRTAMQRENIFHLHRNITMSYTGIELRASDDEIVWLQILTYARQHELGTPFSFTLYQLCKDLQWPTTGHYYKKAEQCLERLRAAVVWIERDNTGVFDIPLIASFQRKFTKSKRGECIITIDPKTILLFFGNKWARINWQEYRNLSDLSRRLYGYIASHREPHPLPLDRLHQLCASNCQCSRQWQRQVKKASQEIINAKLVKSIFIKDKRIHILR